MSPTTVQSAAASSVSPEDLRISATARSVCQFDPILRAVARRIAVQPPQSLLDLGCGTGGLTRHVGRALGIDVLFGADYHPVHAEAARRNGVEASVLDLGAEPVPLPDGRVGLVTSFGVLASLSLYDNALAEAARVLQPGGWLLFSMPNLGSYANRLRLLLGQFGFCVVGAWGFNPDPGRHRLGFLDPLTRSFPSLSRRFVVLARKETSAS